MQDQTSISRLASDLGLQKSSSDAPDTRGLKRGDLIIRRMGPRQPGKQTFMQKMFEEAYRVTSPAVLGSPGHVAMYLGDNQVVEASADGVVIAPFKEHLRGNKEFAAFRSGNSEAAEAAVRNAVDRVGESYGFNRVRAAGASTLFPTPIAKLIANQVSCDGPICATLAGDAYEAAGVKLTDGPSGLVDPMGVASSKKLHRVGGTLPINRSVVGRHAGLGRNALAATAATATAVGLTSGLMAAHRSFKGRKFGDYDEEYGEQFEGGPEEGFEAEKFSAATFLASTAAGALPGSVPRKAARALGAASLASAAVGVPLFVGMKAVGASDEAHAIAQAGNVGLGLAEAGAGVGLGHYGAETAFGKKVLAKAGTAAATRGKRSGATRAQLAGYLGVQKTSFGDMQPGDIILREPKPLPVQKRTLADNVGQFLYRKGGAATQGNLLHAMMYTGGGNVMEVTNTTGLQEIPLADAISSEGYAVYRHKDKVDVDQLKKALRTRSGQSYGDARMIASGVAQLLPESITRPLAAACDGPTCSTAIADAFADTGRGTSRIAPGVAGPADIAFGGEFKHVGGTVTPVRPTLGRYAGGPGRTRVLYGTLAAVPLASGFLAHRAIKGARGRVPGSKDAGTSRNRLARALGIRKRSSEGMRPGDVILREPQPLPAGPRSMYDSAMEFLYRKGGRATQGNMVHAAVYTGDGRAMEIADEGFREVPVGDAIAGQRHAVYRHKNKVNVEQVKELLRSRAGQEYGDARMIASGVQQILPAEVSWPLAEACDGPTCSTAVAEAFAGAGNTTSKVAPGVAGPADIAFGGQFEHVGGAKPSRPMLGRYAPRPGPTRALYGTLAAVPLAGGFMAHRALKRRKRNARPPETIE